MSAVAHVPMRRVLERATAIPGVQPLRIYPLLLPIWGVEVTTTVWESQPYEVFDQYLSRAIGGAGLREISQLAAFFGIEPSLVDRALRFLTTIGHVHRTGETVTLTDLGHRSIADGCRYVRKEDRQILYLDGFTSSPLTTAHYAGVWLDEPRLTLGNTRFHVVSGLQPFRMDALAELARRPDREDFNLPAGLTGITPVEVAAAWLPAYVIECVSSLLVFVKVMDGPDEYLSRLVAPYLSDVLRAEPAVDDMLVWREWLDGMGLHGIEPRRLPNRVLRASLPSDCFDTRIQWWQLGSFETRKATFLQLWCDDDRTRRRAVLERAADMVSRRLIRDQAELANRLAGLAARLEVPVPTGKDLVAHAREAGDDVLAALLAGLVPDAT